MNENHEHHWLFDMGFVFSMCILACGMIAPVFGPMIRNRKYHKYALYSDYKERAETEMLPVWVILWSIAAASWAFILFCGLVMAKN